MDLEQEMVMTAPTVEEAIILGLARLGLTREEADIEVLDEGSKGFLGLGVREARVHVKRRTETVRQNVPVAEPEAPEPAPEPEAAPPPEPAASVSHLTGGSSLAPAGAPVEKPPLKSVEGKAVEKPRHEGPQLEKPASTRPAPETVAPAVKAPRAVAEPADREAIRETVLDIATHFFEALELQVSVDWRDEEVLWVSVRGKDADVLVGPQAQTLDTTQYLLRTVAHHQAPGTYDLVLDADGYRERRQPVPAGVAPPNPGLSAEEQRRLQEIDTARTSRLFAGTESRQTGPSNPGPAAIAPPPAPDLTSLGLAPPPATPTAQERQLAFLNAAADRRTVAPDRVTAPASPNVLQAGAVISAALITGIRSDLPGQITAQVTENIYDSPTGRILLVPQGTRIIGQYDNNVQFGQSRVLLVWNRLIFPNGRSIVLERQPGADSEGYAGLQDGVDYHWWDLAKAAGLSTLLSIGAELATNDDDRLIQAIRNGGQDTINDAGQQIVRRQLNVAPTLTIRPGFPVRVIVTRDLVLEPYGG